MKLTLPIKNLVNENQLIFFTLLILEVFLAYTLYPELSIDTPDTNDNVFHYSLVLSMVEEIKAGGNPIDHWVPYWSIGYPVFHHYQFFPHLATVATYYLLLKSIPLFAVFHFFNFFLLLLFPLCLFFSLKKMGFPKTSAMGAALFSLTIFGKDGYGLELSSYTWAGLGMYTQLWAMCLFPVTLAYLYQTICENKKYTPAIALLLILSMSHMLFGLMAGITAVIFIFKDLEIANIWKRSQRFFIVFSFFGLVSAFFTLPLVKDSPFHAHSIYDGLAKFNSYGFRYIFTQLVNGDLFDFGRLPVFTVLAVVGALAGLGSKKFFYRFSGIGFMLWFLLYFGRPTWGSLLDYFPLSHAIHFHRLVTMVDFFGILSAGICLADLHQWLNKKTNAFVAVLVCCAILAPAYHQIYHKMQENERYIDFNTLKTGHENKDLLSVINTIKKLPAGRVHPGRSANWGKDFKVGDIAVFLYLSTHQISALSYLPFSWAMSGDFSLNFNEFKASHYNLFNVKYLLTPADHQVADFAKRITEKGKFNLYQINTRGYFDLVESPIAIYGDKNSIWNWNALWMKSAMLENRQYLSIFFDDQIQTGYHENHVLINSFDYLSHGDSLLSSDTSYNQQTHHLFSGTPLFSKFKTQTTQLGNLSNERSEKNKYSTTVNVEKDCFLLFKMTYHPGWKATVDEVLTKTVMLSPGLTGVRLQPGTHTVEFRYTAQSWKTPLLFLGLISLLALWFWERRVNHG